MPVDLNTVLTPQDCIEVGQALSARGKYNKAIPFLDFALERQPDNVTAMVNKGCCLVQTKNSPNAKVVLAEATRIDPDNPGAWLNMGAAHAYDMEWDQARLCFEVGISKFSDPLLKSEAHKMLALNLLNQGQWGESLKELYKGIQINPRSSSLLQSAAQVHMLLGQWNRGLPLYEYRHALTRRILVSDIPAWNGETDLSQKFVLLLCEQGAGDLIQFARYGMLLKDTFPRVKVHLRCPDDMVTIIQRYMEFDAVIPMSVNPESVGKYDLQIPLMSVPLLMYKIDKEWIVPPCHIEPRRQPAGIILTWRGNPSHPNDRFRSLPIEDAIVLSSAMRANGRFVSVLQKDATPEDRSMLGAHCDVNNWSDTAELLRNTGTVVTVDTSVAHLAGTLAVPTILMLPANPDWRWGVEGDKTPWYPSMTLVRQKKLGQWDDVFERVLKLLQ